MRSAAGNANASAVCAVVVNWNGWRDTVVCLESLFALGGTPMHVVVCDNGSTDGSVPELERHLRARLPHWQRAEPGIGFVDAQPGAGVRSVHLLSLPRNLGYAGGLNAGIEWARQQWAPRGYWLLNNDVQAQPGRSTHSSLRMPACRGQASAAPCCWNGTGQSVFREWRVSTAVGWAWAGTPGNCPRMARA
jgi:hypothetical protein